MKQKILNFLIYSRFLLIILGINWNNNSLIMDIERWKNVYHFYGDHKWVVAKLLWYFPEFRNLLIYRNKKGLWKYWFKVWYRPMDTLYITTENIGGGLFIQHGFSTIISAKSIGENCWINQQVTIGYNGKGHPPIIGNNVMITCGAKVLGNITIGDNAIIGANAVVIKDVESNSTVGGVPAKNLH